MLTITRKVAEVVFIGDGIQIKVIEIKGNHVKLGIEAPPDVAIYRAEVKHRIDEGTPKK